MARGRVERVADGANFFLDDNREVHLAGIEVPLPGANASDRVPGSMAATTALTALIGGAHVELRQSGVKSDRYGRIVAYAEPLADGAPRSVQAEMIAAGLARVGADIGSQACADELLRREAAARRAALGLWADAYYRPLSADDPNAILKLRGHFALITGKVVSVRGSGATIYVNFGRRWSQDFAVTIRKRNERHFAAEGRDLNGLAGRRVLVRGWIEAHSGNFGATGRDDWHAPWIEVAQPEQIELAGHD